MQSIHAKAMLLRMTHRFSVRLQIDPGHSPCSHPIWASDTMVWEKTAPSFQAPVLLRHIKLALKNFCLFEYLNQIAQCEAPYRCEAKVNSCACHELNS